MSAYEISKQFGDSSLIRNYSEFIQELKYMNVKTVLHGHKHFDLERPYISDEYYDTSDSIINIFAGGSVGTDRISRHTFSIIDFYDKKEQVKLKQRKIVYNDESPEPIKTKQFPPKNNNYKIVKLLDLLETINKEKYDEYKSISQINDIYWDCIRIIEWLSDIFTGFNDTYNNLHDDYKSILFLLYAVNYRTLRYKEIIEKNKNYKSKYNILNEFYENNLLGKDFDIKSEEYHKLFESKSLSNCAKNCDLLLNLYNQNSYKKYLALTMISIFFSDLYLVLTKYADDFKQSIKYKVNIKIEDNKFHENVPTQSIDIHPNADRRGIYIQLLCNDATAHKMAVLFIKEFDLLINKYEDYFNLMNLKLYYILPKIDNNNTQIALGNYNFEAYIPTLLPLLTGDNIYPAKEVFARELIQNSIDAIAVREAKDEVNFSPSIDIEINTDRKNRRYFKIKDNGTGMNRYKIERYFTSIGRSFYSDIEYQDLNISYKPISNFGIGFLSSFMVCREIDVQTKYFTPHSESLKLHIPNYDGCFFIEKTEEIDIGTELVLYLNEDPNNTLNNEKIVTYIQSIMLDIEYNIKINYLDNYKINNICIPSHYWRKKEGENKFKLFVPFSENFNAHTIDYENEVLNDQYVSKYKYGILISSNTLTSKNIVVLNAGIAVTQVDLEELFCIEFYDDEYPYRIPKFHNPKILLNFPSNWIQLDVSREKLIGFSNDLMNSNQTNSVNLLRKQISETLLEQVLWIVHHPKSVVCHLPVINLQYSLYLAFIFCGEEQKIRIRNQLLDLQYILCISLTVDSIDFSLVHKKNDESYRIIYDTSNLDNFDNLLNKMFSNIVNLQPSIFSTFDFMHVNKKDMRKNYDGYFDFYYEHFLANSEIKIKKNIKDEFSDSWRQYYNNSTDKINNDFLIWLTIMLLSPYMLKKNRKLKSIDDVINMSPVTPIIEQIIMEKIKICDVENNTNQIKIKYETLSKLFE